MQRQEHTFEQWKSHEYKRLAMVWLKTVQVDQGRGEESVSSGELEQIGGG